MRVAIYPRVSTDHQVEEGHSLEAQIDRCRAYCVSQGWEIYDIYTEEGESAKDLNRTKLQQLLKDAEQGLFDVVLVYKLDRLTRSVRDLHSLLDTFEKNGVKFRSATEIYDTTTAMGKLFITIVAALAEWERGNLAERVRFGMEELVRNGNWPGGPVPFGYRWDGETMHIEENESRIMRELRRMYMDEPGLSSTAKRMNALGLLRNGAVWSQQTVGSALDNPFYAGKIRYGGKKKNGKYVNRKKEERVEVIWSDSGYPTIFTWEEYLEHTAVMKKREFYGHSNRRDYWFTGILRCARCGSAMFARPYSRDRSNGTITTVHVNYLCINRDKSGTCNLPLLRQVLAEKLIMEHLKNISLARDEISSAVEQDVREASEVQRQLDEAEKEIKQVRERKKKWMYMLANELMTEKEFRDIKRDEDEKERLLENHMDKLKNQEMGMNLDLADAVLTLPNLWTFDLEDTDRRDVMQSIFKSIYVDCKQETGKDAKKGKFLDFFITDINFN